MKVELVSYTKDGERVVAIASKMSRSRKVGITTRRQ
jgi:thymidylate synthase (FAD) (EC 2.1.1.148)